MHVLRSPLLAALAVLCLLVGVVAAAPPSCGRRTSSWPGHSSPLAPPSVRPFKGDRDASILQLLRADRRFTKLVSALSRAGGNLRDDLDDPRARTKITLLSPTDEAFETLEKMRGMSIEAMDAHELSRILAYHVVPAEHEGRGGDDDDDDDNNEDRIGRRTGHDHRGASGPIRKEDMCDGETLKSALIEKRLGSENGNNNNNGGDRDESDMHQRIRVTKYGGRVVLNMYAQVIDADMEAANGIVHALADVLTLPETLFDGITFLPTLFSTHALALALTGLERRVNTERGVTALIPSNAAWESLGFFETMELFHPRNREMLKRTIERHYISDVLYLNEIIREEEGDEGKSICTRMGGHGGNIEKEAETWAGDRVKVRIECRKNGIDMMIDNSLITLADIPSANGVMHVLTVPLQMPKDKKRHGGHDNDDDNDDDDEDTAARRRRHHRHHGHRHGRRHHAGPLGQQAMFAGAW